MKIMKQLVFTINLVDTQPKQQPHALLAEA